MSPSQAIVLGDIGVEIGGPVEWHTRSGVEKRDLNIYTVTIEYQKPADQTAGTVREWTVNLITGASNHEAYHITASGDIDVKQRWRYRVRVRFGSTLDLRSPWRSFEVID